ncbi:MAG TPA: N4-gp56 family major capsid protein [Bradyrhizobium sp.]
MAAPITTTSNIAGPVNFVFQETLLRTARPRAVYFAGSVPAEIEEHSGTFSAKWRRIENLTATTTPLAELTGNVSFPTRTSVQPTVTDTTATVQKYGNFIILSEEVDLINFNGQADDLVVKMGINSGQSLNRLQRNILEANVTIYRPAGATNDGTTGSAITSGISRKGVNVLQNNVATEFMGESRGEQAFGTAPVPTSFLGLCHVDVEADIRTFADFIPVERYAGQVETFPGEFGIDSIARIRWVSHPEATVSTGVGAASTTLRNTTGNADLYTSIVMGQDAHGSVGLGFEHIREIYEAGDKLPGIQLITHARGSAGTGDPLNELSSLGWKSWHTGALLNTNWILGIRSGATLLQ